jgi:hypothetical protein
MISIAVWLIAVQVFLILAHLNKNLAVIVLAGVIMLSAIWILPLALASFHS